MRTLAVAAVAVLMVATTATAAALPGLTLPAGAPPDTALLATARPATAPAATAQEAPTHEAAAQPAGRPLAAVVAPGADQRQPSDDPTLSTGGTASVQTAATDRPRGVLVWPLSPRPAIHRRFEQPRDQWSRGHRGVDLLAAVGQAVLSSGDGVVAFSGVIAGRGVMTVRHAAGLRTTYEPVDQRLTSGTRVHRGTAIGVISSTAGHCMPLACLHWGAISGATYRDPLLLLGIGRPILLPLG